MAEFDFDELMFKLGFDSVSEFNKKKARLFPCGSRRVEDEQTTTSIFLAALVGIKEFRESLLKSLGIREALKISNQTAELFAYTEIAPPNEFNDSVERPDALLVLTTGKQSKTVSWTAWIESKVGKNSLCKDQLKRYLSVGKKLELPTVISISNEFVSQSNINPSGIVDKNLFHWSWSFILSQLRQVKHRGIKDEDQHYIASELIFYLENHKGISDFNHMGKTWKIDAEYVSKAHSLKTDEAQICSVVRAWSQEEKDIALKLADKDTGKTGYHPVCLGLNKAEMANDNERANNLKRSLAEKRVLKSTFMIPDLKEKFFTPKQRYFDLTVYLTGTRILLEMHVAPFKGTKSVSQLSSLLQILTLSGQEDEINIKAEFARKKFTQGESIKNLLKEKENKRISGYKILEGFPKEPVKRFTIFYYYDFMKKNKLL